MNRHALAPRGAPLHAPARKLLHAAVTAALAAAMLAPPQAHARITQFQILNRAIAFGGYSFANVGQYEVITGIATGEVNPSDPRNAIITDIALAPRLANGNVRYQHNFYILKPLDLSKGNHKMMYEPPNRGGKTHGTLNRGVGGNDPAATTDPVALANTFLWPRGYTTAWSGWENNLGALNGLTATAALPVAVNPDGSTITGPAYEYIVSGSASFTLTYPAASGNQGAPDAVLTHRIHLDDVAQVVPASGWAYTNANHTAIKLTSGNFVNNDIYEFSYIAKNPTVLGVGFAAVRDFNSFLRYASADDFGTPNPLAGDVTRIYTEISSQPGRLLNDFRHLGFNEDESGRKVLDGLMQWVAAGDGINMNYRWAQTGRTERNRQDELYLEGLFPFANVTTFDPISGQTDGRYVRCTQTNTCPLAMEFYSSNEYWVKPASLFHTDPTGSVDLPDHPQARLYLLSSKQHGGAGNAASKGACQNFLNPLDSAPVQRALFQDLDEWSTRGIAPPASRIPKLSDHTMGPVPPAAPGVGYAGIPGVTYTGLKTTRYRFNYGPNFYATGIPTINPPVITPPIEDNPLNGPIYPSYVPTWDADGNEIPGIRLTELDVPLATYMGWNLRSGVWANDGCEGSGSYVPFARTRAERLASGDPRPSVEERYPSFAQYAAKVMVSMDGLIKDRLVLCEDAADMQARLLQAGLDAGVPPPKGNNPAQPLPAQCRGSGK
ncbi:MAG TPA: alpha/beta hydrolase domain-containing protein [Usitatibacter sp.]|nr:alpha/beta hydrolase domain-containing protein [Usitatibacter sp.]